MRVACVQLILLFIARPSEKRHFVALVETGVITAVPDHELVAHFVMDAALVLFDE